MADAHALGACTARCEGSSPSFRTRFFRIESGLRANPRRPLLLSLETLLSVCCRDPQLGPSLLQPTWTIGGRGVDAHGHLDRAGPRSAWTTFGSTPCEERARKGVAQIIGPLVGDARDLQECLPAAADLVAVEERAARGALTFPAEWRRGTVLADWRELVWEG